MDKSLITAVTASILSISTVVFAATYKEIKEAAKAEVPAGCVMVSYDESKPKVEIRFKDSKTLLTYELEVNKDTAKVEEMEILGANIAGSTNIVKSSDDIKKTIRETYPDVQSLDVGLVKDGQNNYKYEAKFSTEKYREVEAEFNPVTGVFTKREIKFR